MKHKSGLEYSAQLHVLHETPLRSVQFGYVDFSGTNKAYVDFSGTNNL
jgi:hypothetical protein